MSRMERHRKHREGDVDNNAKSDFEDIEESFKVNPIASKEDEDAKRKKTYDRTKLHENMVVQKNRELKEVQQRIGNKKELFDIEVAFKNIEQKRKDRHVDSDTQAQIITEIFSNELHGYQNISYEKDETTNKILISEEELLKLLDEREKNYKKERERKKRKERLVRKQEEIINKQSKFDEENLLVNKVSENKITKEIEEDFIVENVSKVVNKKYDIPYTINDFEPKEFYNNKTSTILKVVLIILVLVLAYFVFMFFR